MRHPSRVFLHGRCVLALLLLGAVANTPAAQQPTGGLFWEERPEQVMRGDTLRGVALMVRDSQGNAMPDVRVRLLLIDPPSQTNAPERTTMLGSGTSDAQGRAVFGRVGLPFSLKSSFRLTATLDNGARALPVDVRVIASAPDQLIEIRPPPASPPNGSAMVPAPQFRVMSKGNPVPGLLVTMSLTRGDGAIGGDQVLTNEQGYATFPELRITTRCAAETCTEQIIVARAHDLHSREYSVKPYPRSPAKLVLEGDHQRDAVLGQLMFPLVRVRALSATDTPVGGATILAHFASGHSVSSDATDENGYATFKNLVPTGRSGLSLIVFSAGSATQVMTLNLAAGEPNSLSVLVQPPPRISYDSLWSPAPSVRVHDAFGNPVPNAEVRLTLCVRELEQEGNPPWECGGTIPSKFLAGIRGNALVRTDTNGVALFDDIRLSGKSGEYAVEFSARTGGMARSNGIVYNPKRAYDRNFVVISAIKTISGAAPDDEFFDLRFRFRLSRRSHILAHTDVALSARGSDTVASRQKKLTEAALMANVNLYSSREFATDIPERLVFVGAQGKVFNTIPYYGFQVGGTELGGSVFQGSSLSVGYLHRWYGDTSAVVGGDTIGITKHNVGIDFLLRSSIVEFFKVLTIRGGIMLPLHRRGTITSRIAVAVPIGEVYSF